MTTVPLRIEFPVAERASHSDAKLYSHAAVPSMDQLEHDYILELIVRAADPDQERLLADTCTRAINQNRQSIAALQLAYEALDSVAHLQAPGDTDNVKAVIADALGKLGAQLQIAWVDPAAKVIERTTVLMSELHVGDWVELNWGQGTGLAIVEQASEGLFSVTLKLSSRANFFELSGTRSQTITKVVLGA